MYYLIRPFEAFISKKIGEPYLPGAQPVVDI